jgi:PAS domain-containing protein
VLIHQEPAQFRRNVSGESAPEDPASATSSTLHLLSAEACEAKRLFESLLQSLSGLFYRCEVRPPWKINYISDGVEALTGYGVAEILGKHGWAEIMMPQDRGVAEATVAAAIRDGGATT